MVLSRNGMYPQVRMPNIFHKGIGKEIIKMTETNNHILAVDYQYTGEIFATAGKDYKVSKT